MLRGIDKRRIFEERADYEFFLGRFARILRDSDIICLAYCLMSNHIHLLLKEGDVPLSHFIKRIGISYAYYFNNKYGRAGHLFQDRFKSEAVQNDRYFLAVLGYILQNPVSAGLCENAGDYEWSSMSEFERKRRIVDESELFAIVSESDMREAVGKIPEIAPFSAIARGRKPMYSEEEAILLMQDIANIRSATQFHGLDKQEQETVVMTLRGKGVSIRQIARICGTGRGLIERWSRQ
jgi:REP element-mobilizing transposase RayT